jgi:uncharacterized protein with HEPN domain
MTENRQADYLEHMRQAAANACSFVEGVSKADFLSDRRTQQAVIMSLIIIGEAVAKLMDGHGEFTRDTITFRGAAGYFEIDLDVVWETVQLALPELIVQLDAVRQNQIVDDNNERSV